MDNTVPKKYERSGGIQRRSKRFADASTSRQPPKQIDRQGNSPIGFEAFHDKYKDKKEKENSSNLYPDLSDHETDSEQSSTCADSPSPSYPRESSPSLQGKRRLPSASLEKRQQHSPAKPSQTNNTKPRRYSGAYDALQKSICLFFIICVLFLLFDYLWVSRKEVANDPKKMIEFESGINLMKAGGLSQQNPGIWKRLRSIGKHLLVSNLTQPAVLPVVHDSSDIADCFIGLFQEVTCKVVHCNDHLLFDYSSGWDLHDHLGKALDGGTLWMMKDFELIKSQDAVQFLSYADHDSAPYKHAFIVILVKTEDSSSKAGKGSMDEHVEKALEANLQGKVKQDKVYAIVSRLSSYGIILKEDDHYKKHGCPRIN